MSPYRQMSLLAVFALVILRVAVGVHFFKEGQSKVEAGDFQSEGFLSAARGPLADKYHQLIWDYDGTFRLDNAKMSQQFTDYVDAAKKHFAFSDQQSKDAFGVLNRQLKVLETTYSDYADELLEYNKGFARNDAMESDPKWAEVSSLRGQRDEIKTKWRAKILPVLKNVDAVWSDLETSINDIPTDQQVAAVGYFSFDRPNSGPIQASLVDKIIPIFDLSIGICLIVGLLTPVASLLAAGFLISVVLSQFPGYPGTQPTYYQAIEAAACLVLCFTDAGRYAGLDFIPWSFWANRRAKRLANESV